MFYQSDRYQVRVHRITASRTQWHRDQRGKSYEATIIQNSTYRALCLLGAEARKFLINLQNAEDKDAFCATVLR